MSLDHHTALIDERVAILFACLERAEDLHADDPNLPHVVAGAQAHALTILALCAADRRFAAWHSPRAWNRGLLVGVVIASIVANVGWLVFG